MEEAGQLVRRAVEVIAMATGVDAAELSDVVRNHWREKKDGD